MFSHWCCLLLVLYESLGDSKHLCLPFSSLCRISCHQMGYTKKIELFKISIVLFFCIMYLKKENCYHLRERIIYGKHTLNHGYFWNKCI